MKSISPKIFKNPPKKYSAVPFWFWNDVLDEETIAFQLDEMYDKGIYECIIHARKGLETEYLSDAWFDRIRFAAGRAREKGMKLWIYDEDNWPSGYAGGRVIADNPDFAAICLSVEKIYPVMYKDIVVPEVPGKELMSVVAVYRNEEFYDITDYDHKCCKPWHSETLQWEVFVFRIEKCGHKPVYVDSPYIDLLNPAATDSFIRHTHAEYKKRLPEYWGSTICGFFTDEPGFYQNYIEQAKNINTVIWTRDFRERFRERFGYDITLRLFSLWEEAGDISASTRRDYYAAVSLFYCESYFRRIRDFLAADGLKLIGHLHREEGLQTLVQTEGGFFDCMAELDYTGVDCIDRRFPRMTEKLGSSAMRVLGKERCMDEVFGAFGWGLTPQEMKIRTDYLFAQGINMIVPHAFFYSTEGVRGHECPPSLFVQTGYWKFFRNYADYVRRMSLFCSAGDAETDGAVYYPEYSARAQFRPLEKYEVCKTDEFIVRVGETLEQNHLDYDILPDRAFSGRTGTNIGSYGFIVLPNVRYLPAETAKRLCVFAENGGRIFCLGNAEIEGIGSERRAVALLMRRILRTGMFVRLAAPEEISATIKSLPQSFSVVGDAEGVLFTRRRLSGKRGWYLVNTTPGRKEFSLLLPGSSAEIWNAETGEVRPAVFSARESGISVSCSLDGYGASIVMESKEDAPSASPLQLRYTERRIAGKWLASARGLKRETAKLTFHELGLHEYSGEVSFTKKIRIGKTGEKVSLRLNDVRDYVYVYVNGKFAGARLWAPYTFELTPFLKRGENELVLTVGNMLENEMERTDSDAGVFGTVALLYGGE